MNQLDTLISVFKKYRFFYPVNKRDQKRINKAKKRTLKYIIRKSNIKSSLLAVKLALYYRLRSIGISIKIATSSRIINAAFSFAVLILIFSSLLLIANNFLTAPPTLAQGTVTFLIGKATIKTEKGETFTAKVKDTVNQGDTITTGKKTQVNLQFETGKILKLLPESQVTINSASLSKENEFHLVMGTILSKIQKLKKGEEFRIRTNNAIAAVRGTRYSVSYQPVKTVISSAEGSLDVSLINESGKILNTKKLKAGFRAIITDKIVMEPVSKVESLTLEQIANINYLNNFYNLSDTELNKISNSHHSYLKKIEEKINFLQKDEKYDHLYTILLYDGRKITGYVESRGSKWKILTQDGVISINKNTIRKIK